MGDAGDVANAAMKCARVRCPPSHPALFLSSKKPAECDVPYVQRERGQLGIDRLHLHPSNERMGRELSRDEEAESANNN